jgi:hypothetical protein
MDFRAHLLESGKARPGAFRHLHLSQITIGLEMSAEAMYTQTPQELWVPF